MADKDKGILGFAQELYDMIYNAPSSFVAPEEFVLDRNSALSILDEIIAMQLFAEENSAIQNIRDSRSTSKDKIKYTTKVFKDQVSANGVSAHEQLEVYLNNNHVLPDRIVNLQAFEQNHVSSILLVHY